MIGERSPTAWGVRRGWMKGQEAKLGNDFEAYSDLMAFSFTKGNDCVHWQFNVVGNYP